MTILHADLIARRVRGLWLGVLIEGPAGAGKSDLALRALRRGFRLVADDRVLVFLSDGRLYGRAPEALAGLFEVRGLGVIPHDYLPFARIALKVTCAPSPAGVDRAPEAETATILGIATPTLAIWPFEVSAPVKLTAMLEHLGAGA
ncbi:MAG TPA: HPr kinase/phosphorylase [Caulobacteraceae bacterium]|jgi:serine kinase of HPr protein (carbohydrate metabolism regulator)